MKRLAISLIAVFSLIAIPNINWAQLPVNFQETTLLSGLNQPIAMEFLPDGRMLLCEKGGVIKIAEGPNYTTTANYLSLTNINSGQERGLIDIAIDPNFSTNNYIYIYYSQASPSRFRIARFTHQENSGGLTSQSTMASEFLVWEDTDNFSSCCHYGGGLSFGNDGKLYLSVGDEFNGNQSQDLTKAGGKIIRVNSDGTIPPDNPFVDGPGGNHDAIWAYGLRNPFRAKWDLPGDKLYIAEVGGNVQSTAMEDVHVGELGANFGWPFCEGNDCTWPSGEPANFSEAIYSYDHTANTPNGGSITGGFVYRGSQFPAEFQGVYFFGDYAIEYIRYLTFDATGNVTGDFDFHTDPGLVVAIDEGPDGSLYYCDISGSVKRVVFDNGNQSPGCVSVTASANQVQISDNIDFNADVEDGEDDELTYEWIWGDGSSSSGSVPSGSGVRSLPQESHSYSSNGLYTVTLEISDASHISLCQTVEIQVGNPPEATIDTPIDGILFQAGDEIGFSGSATDSDGPLTAANYSWEMRFIHNDHYHPEFGPTSGLTSGTLDIPTSGHDFGDNTSFQFILVVTDSDGLTDSDTVYVFPDKVDITYESVPSGLTINIDGIARTTPFVIDDLIGFEREVIVGASQCIGDVNYDFDNWSNSEGTSQTYIVPNADETLTVTFTENGDCSAPVTNGLVLQLEGDLGVTDDGSQITSWVDQSGSSNDLSMIGAGPALVPSSLNGHNTVSFDGVNDALGRTGFTGLPTGSNDRSVFMVVRYNSNGWGGFSYGNNGTNETFGLTVSNSGELAVQGWGGANDFPSSTNGTDNTWITQSVVLSSDAFSLFKNGNSILTAVHAFGTATDKIRLGSEIDDAPNVAMEVAEILVYDRAVNETERQQVEAYFQQKYFPLGTGPTVDVLSPTEGEVITGDAVTVSWSTDNMAIGDHIHLTVDGQMPHITVMQQNGSYGLTGLSPGPHDVLVQVARQDHVLYTNEEASQTVNFTMQEATGGGDCNLVTDGLVLHLESDLNIVTSAGTDVSGWLDQSGNGNDLSGSGAPQLIAAGGPNGQPFVSFDGVDDYLERTTTLTGFPTGSQDRTMFFVARYIDSPVYAGASFGDGANNQAFGLIVTNGGILAVQGWGGGNDFVSTEAGVGAGWLSQSVLLESDAFTQYKDGQALNSGTHTFNTDLNRFVLAEEIANIGFAEIDVAAVFVFNRALSETERTQMEDYIQDKYFGVTCAPDVCAISAISAGSQTACDPVTNTYNQDIEITYSNPPASGTLDVNGQSFTITASPQTVTLTGLTADGLDVDVTVSFSAEAGCFLSENALFTAPSNCEPVINCNLPTDGLVLHLETDAGIVQSGNNVTGWNDQSPSANDLAANGTPELGLTTTPTGYPAITFNASENDQLERTAGIVGLPAGNTDRTVFVVTDYRSADWGGFAYGNAGNCNEVFGLIVKPNGNLTVQGWCDDFDSGVEGTASTPDWLVHSATYESDLLQHFKDGEQIGIDINHTFNTVVNSIVLGAEIDGNPHLDMDVAAILVYDRALTDLERLTVEGYLQSKYLDNPVDCGLFCAIDNVEAGAQTACDPLTNTYTQDIEITYTNPPASGTLDVNGQSFPITSSPQTVTLTGLVANGLDVNVAVAFSDDQYCKFDAGILFSSPANCAPPLNCELLSDGLVLHLEADGGVTTTGSSVNIWSDQSPSGNDLTAVGNPEIGSVLTPSGMPAISFNQAQGDKLERTSAIAGLPTGDEDRTAFIVVDYKSDGYGGFAYGNAGSCNEVFGLIVDPNGNLMVQGWCNDFDSGVQGNNASPAWMIHSATHEASTLEQFKNGDQIGATVGHSFNTVVNQIVLGAEIDGNPLMEMDVAAVLVYDRALNELERLEVEGYLQQKYLGIPNDCSNFCAMESIAVGTQTACEPTTDTYSQEIILTYENAPVTGTLDVNGQSFVISSSPQTVTLTGLVADGNPVDVTANFSDEPACIQTETALFAAPVSCAPTGPIIDVWYGNNQEFGNNGEPQVWCNIQGNVSDADGGNITEFEYTLNGGSPVALSIGADGRRLLNTGDFNVDLAVTDLVAGPNTVAITATDNDDNTAIEVVTINYTPGNTWPNPYNVDWSTLSDITDVNNVAHVVDGKFELTPEGIRTSEAGYDRLIAIGDKDWTNYEVLVPITIHTMPGGAGVGVLLRWKGHTDNPVVCPQPKCGWQPLGDIAWYRPGQLQFYEGGNTSRSLNLDTKYWYRVNVETDGVGNTNYKMKVWEDGTPEPGPWDLEKTTGPTDEQEGSLLLISHKADVTFGNVEVTPGPLSITNIQVQLANGNTEATITWDTNQDADSRIDYGPSCAFEDGFLDDASEVSSHSLTLTGLTPNSIYQYQLTSANAGGSVSTGCLLFSTYSSGIVSDDFCDGSLNPVWTFDDPLGDAGYAFTGTATNDAWLEITVPAGQGHQLYTDGIEAPNMLQPVNNADFEVEVKFESGLTSPQYQQQGILVKESANKYLRFEFFSTNGGQVHIYSQAFNLPAASAAFINQSITTNGVSPMYMRVKREGNQWTQTYSLDGSTWLSGASFTYALTPTQIGPYAGNAIGGGSPAHTAQIDYFLNLDDPIVSEDDCNPLLPPVLAAIGDQFAQEETPQNVVISATDADGNDADLVFSATVLPPFIQVVNNMDGTADLQINPADGDAGTYTITVEVEDLDGQLDSETITIIVSETGVGPSNLISDDFCSGSLAEPWTFVDPQADGSQGFVASGLDAWLEIGVPAGNDHELWDEGIQVPHIIQSINDTDFELVVKFNSAVTAPQFKEQGVLVKQDDNHFLRFEFYSSNSNTNAITAVITGSGVPLSTNITANTAIGAANVSPLYMRVTRTGDQWTQEYSFDNSSWTQSSSFTHALNAAGVGLYAGNAGGNPAHTAQIDYIESTDDPLGIEDECQIVEGCTDPAACNFNASANTPDGSCTYATGCDTCSGETDGTGTVVDNDADDDGDCDDTDPCPNNANAYLDICDVCVGGDTGLEACCIMDAETSFTFATLGFSNGSASVESITDGQPPFSYQWNDPFMQTTATAMGLFPGNYTCTITDDFGCSIEVEVTVPLFVGIYGTKVHTNYCNTGGYDLEDFIPCDPIDNADAYRWEFTEQGGSTLPEYTRIGGNQWIRLMWVNGIQLGTTYEVRVKARVSGEWGAYDEICTISTASDLPLTEVRPQYHPTNSSGDNYKLCDFAIAYNVNSANNFRWRFDPDTDPNNGNEVTYVRGSGNPAVRLSWVNNLMPASQYHVAVEARIGTQWAGYGPVHMIELAQPEAPTLRSSYCSQTYALNGYVLATSVCEANYYQFEFEPVGGGAVSIVNSGNYVAFFNNASPSLSPGDYNVRVRVNQNGVLGNFGASCMITIGGAGLQQESMPALRNELEESFTEAVLFPNPSNGREVRVQLENIGDGNHNIQIEVFDIFGKQVAKENFGHRGDELNQLIRFESPVAKGVYTVRVIANQKPIAIERLVVN